MYSYFIICNTNDPNDFHIEMTTMKDYRLRFSAMKSNHTRKFGRFPPVSIHKHSDTDTDNLIALPTYHNLLKKNYAFFLLEKKHFLNFDDALTHKQNLIKCRSELFKDNTVRDPFTVKFNP